MTLRSIKPLYLSKSCRLLLPSMLDTVRFNVLAKLRSPVPPDEWKAMGLKGFCDTERNNLRALECSLPRLLYKHNGRMISNQEEMGAAFALLVEKASEFAELPALSEWKPSRFDLVWQFQVPDARAIIDAFSGFRYPTIRTPPIHQAERCVTWKGAGSRFIVQAYNKSLKMRQKGNVLRLEVRMIGNELRRLRGRDWQNFLSLYATYREIVVLLPELKAVGKSGGWPEAIARGTPSEYHEVILSLVDLSDRTKRAVRQRIRMAQATLESGFSLKRLLPPDKPPLPVIVEPRKRRVGTAKPKITDCQAG